MFLKRLTAVGKGLVQQFFGWKGTFQPPWPPRRLLLLLEDSSALTAALFLLIGCITGFRLCGTPAPKIENVIEMSAKTAEATANRTAVQRNAQKTRLVRLAAEQPVDLQEEEASETQEETPESTENSPYSLRGYSTDALNELVNQVLQKIITSGMSKREQAYSVFRYVNSHVRYVGDSVKTSWQEGAYEGLYTGRGDCYTYYALSRALLTALGIDNLEVRRVGGTSSHFWNLVNCGDGWYHFDAGPHSVSMDGASFFLFTDQDAMNYTQKAGRNYYDFDGSLYPPRAGGPAEPEAVPEPAPQEPETPVSEEPILPEEPAASETPPVSEDPVVPGEPVFPEESVVLEEPPAFEPEEPAAEEPPVAEETPSVEEIPPVLESPGVEVPTPTEEPSVTNL